MKEINSYIIEKLKLNKDSKVDDIDDLLNKIQKKISLNTKIALNHFATILKEGHYSDHYDTIINHLLMWLDTNNIKEVEVYLDKMFAQFFKSPRTARFKLLSTLDFAKLKNSFNIPLDTNTNGFPKKFAVLHSRNDNRDGIGYYVTDEVFYIDTDAWDILFIDNTH